MPVIVTSLSYMFDSQDVARVQAEFACTSEADFRELIEVLRNWDAGHLLPRHSAPDRCAYCGVKHHPDATSCPRCGAPL